ncbi:MAG: 4-hydroxyphenylacetate 3-hydroxylase family protein [Candidatus Lokiarchaeota archaeon]|nr:4-hydroxyphenylacetate 3-hydroxylase family protein [Candidatus Lokiarchaeota archaeon]
MVIKSGLEYRQSLKQRKRMNIYFMGEKINDPLSHPIMKAAVNSIALTYDLACDPEYKHVMTTKSAITGEKINRFCHIHQSTEDLIKKVEMLRILGQKTGTCFQRCVGMDAMNAVYITTFEIDEKYGTDYHKRFQKYVIQAEENDWTIDGCMTDPKGDRSKRPSEQKDLDLYVHVVKRIDDGVVIRGAKAHQTGAINSHEHLIMPTLTMRKEDKDYTICCAVPADDPKIIYIYGRQASDLRRLDDSESGDIDCGNPEFGGQEALVIFDDVFVPRERIFMNGETDFCGRLVETFAAYHRQSYGGCKVGVGDILIGAAATISEYNGTKNASHIRDKITEMVHLNETLYSCGIACSSCGQKTSSGNYLVDILLANVCKQNVTRFPFDIARLLHDIAGGIFVTMPSAKDLSNPETAKWVKKYLSGVEGIETKDRMKMMRLIENLVLGRAAVGYLTESMHGAGSPQAQKIMIQRLVDIELKKRYAKTLAHIKDES